ncbi:MAG: type IV pilus assembly protein PilM [Candidatus Eremiobacteraeota bacterium]|nr:type IV pilus assembly protein PilM [Candidatus Eremiobacteraeota bacterium]MBC5827414.1 type IV pilus assembly protein PilM [Candidatus Eremiobacteraeota bacterium]
MSLFGKMNKGGAQRYIGIDFGSFELKAVQFAPSPRGPLLEHVYKVPTPANAIKDGVITDPPLIGEALRQMIADGAFTAKRTVSAVAGPTVVVRQVTMPAMNERELLSSTKYEAERFLPYSVEEAQIDAKILGRSDDGQNMDVLIVSAQKDLVISQMAALAYVSLSPAVIEVEPFSLVRAMLAPDDAAFEQNIAIINVGASSTSINITKGGFVPFTRNVPIGGNAITKAIATGLNVSLEEAEKMKREKAAILSQRDSEPVAPTVTRIFNVITPPLTELVTEIHKSLDYFRTRFRGEVIESVILGGGTARLASLDAFLSHELALPVTLADPLGRATYNPADFPADYLRDMGPALMVATGLARRDLQIVSPQLAASA